MMTFQEKALHTVKLVFKYLFNYTIPPTSKNEWNLARSIISLLFAPIINCVSFGCNQSLTQSSIPSSKLSSASPMQPGSAFLLLSCWPIRFTVSLKEEVLRPLSSTPSTRLSSLYAGSLRYARF